MSHRAFGGENGWVKPFIHLADNLISKVGIVLVTTAVVAWLFVLPVELSEGHEHPYLGILFYVILPTMFFLGLAIIPVGIMRKLRAEQKAGTIPKEPPALEWANPELRRLIKLIGIATVINIIVGGYYTNAAVQYMDSANFCGQTCHVMAPEFTAYQDSPHVNVPCTECHVGSGATAYIDSKMRGAGQLLALIMNNYEKPVPTPVHTLRPARDICEQCHWPQKFGGYRIDVLDKFDDDEANTTSKTVLVMRIGGGSMTEGIHGFHTKPGVVIEYAATPDRMEIPWIRYIDPDGKSTEYATEAWAEADQSTYEMRTMDCLDCHTRPSHHFQIADRAVNEALSLGRIDASLPWAKKHALEILNAEYASTEEAEEQIPAAFVAAYRDEDPDTYAANREAVEQSAQGVLAVFRRNVFPEMDVTWGTYPDQIGHEDFPGCFRCHDYEHESSDGESISQDCSACHELLAMEESDPEILGSLGIR
jgi:nitrate/TMAO reductase-like tetraheme cytochrome c subunit